MITETDSLSTIELADKYVILPATRLWDIDEFMAEFRGRPCDPGFRYSSGENSEWLSVDQLRTLIRQHVDPQFAV